MRQAIRVYAAVALIAVGALVAGLWMHPESITGAQDWGERALGAIYGLQLWLLLVVPLGVLAASVAARAGRRGWLTLIIALLVLAPIAAWIDPLTNNIQVLLTPYCPPNVVCPSGPYGTSQLVMQVGWAAAFLPIPLASLIYSFTAARSPSGPTTARAGEAERRTLLVGASVGIVVMGALGYLSVSPSLLILFVQGSPAPGSGHESARRAICKACYLQGVLYVVWFTLAALPVAIASLAPAHATQTGRRGWLAGWIALATLGLLTADLGFIWAWILIFAVLGAHSSDQVSFFEPVRVVGFVAPVVVMLLALLYALKEMRSRPHAAALAAA